MTVAYPLDETRLSFIEKSQTVYDFGLETNRHPPSIHLSGDKWFINRFFFKQSKRCGRKYDKPMDVSTSIEDEKPVFHPTIGREGEGNDFVINGSFNIRRA